MKGSCHSCLTWSPRARTGCVMKTGNVRVVAEIDGSAAAVVLRRPTTRNCSAERADHVAVALLLPAMRHARDLRIGGVVTDSLLHRLNHDLQSLVRSGAPELPLGRGDG